VGHEATFLKADSIYLGDCRILLPRIRPDSIDLIITSPPYADNRRTPKYKGVRVDEYVEWFSPISKELLRVLKPAGSFILNIKERVVDAERHSYVLKLILEMKEQGWKWTEEYIWCKANCYPGKWPNRFRDSWERLLHFTKGKDFKMRQERVMEPVGKWASTRLRKLSEKDRTRDESRTDSGFGKNVSKWLTRDMVYPTNVLHLATESSNRNHSAAFPIRLPAWFIKLFTDEGDCVLDPFVGAGTTALASIDLNRHYIGFEISEIYYLEALRAVEKRKSDSAIARNTGEPHERRRKPGRVDLSMFD